MTRDLDIDDPGTTALRRSIIEHKPFLRRTYEEWYGLIRDAVPPGPEPVLELGSGAGFLRRFVPTLITSEVVVCPGVDLVLDGRWLPLGDACLRGIAMTNVLHHLPDPRRFLAEAARCVRRGGVVVMIEPWVTAWSTRVYTRWHHEPFDPRSSRWEFPPGGRLSGANGALAWIIFHRDRQRFEREFPQWRVRLVRPFMPVRYLLSGGVSMRSLMPGFAFGFWRSLERGLDRCRDSLAMFALVVLDRVA